MNSTVKSRLAGAALATSAALAASSLASRAEAMASPQPPTATSHPEWYCADRESDGYYDPNDCTQFHVENDLPAELFVLLRRELIAAGREVAVEAPPIEANLLRLVERANEKADPNGEQLDLRQRHLDVPRDHESFVEDTVENVNKARGAVVGRRNIESHVAANYILAIAEAATRRPRHGRNEIHG